jgi:hypothetical protein
MIDQRTDSQPFPLFPASRISLPVGILTSCLAAMLLWSGCDGRRGSLPPLDPSVVDRVIDPTGSGVLRRALAAETASIRAVMSDVDAHEVQILFSRVHRHSDTGVAVTFTEESFQLDADAYFYPASTVKMPAAFLALELLNEPDVQLREVMKRIPLTMDTPFKVEGDSVTTTIRQEIVKIFVVSDNDAHDRLHDLLGRDRFNAMMADKGLAPYRMAHRLSMPGAYDDAHRALWFFGADGDSASMERVPATPVTPLEIGGLVKGAGYMEGDSLVGEPFGFAMRNHAPLRTLHETLQRVIFPEAFPAEERFHHTEEQTVFLDEAMRMLPAQAGYDTTYYYPAYVKFLMFGDTADPIPPRFSIANKVGEAYGTLTDVAYITDAATGIEFMLSATILVNANGVFNDDVYEYESVGYPFLAELGRQVHAALVTELEEASAR